MRTTTTVTVLTWFSISRPPSKTHHTAHSTQSTKISTCQITVRKTRFQQQILPNLQQYWVHPECSLHWLMMHVHNIAHKTAVLKESFAENGVLATVDVKHVANIQHTATKMIPAPQKVQKLPQLLLRSYSLNTASCGKPVS